MLEYLIIIASGLLSTTYGHGEINCGDIGSPVPCEVGAVTASGVPFDPSLPQAAVAAPSDLRLRARSIKLRVDGGPCRKIQLVDKMNPRYIGKRGFDLTPEAVRLLTGKPATAAWSGIVHVCGLSDWRDALNRTQPLHIIDTSHTLAIEYTGV